VALKLSLADPNGRQETRTLAAGTLSIGRSERSDWVLPDPNRHLSKTHCVISVEDGRYLLTDLSVNGVYINGARQPTVRDSQVVLTDGDEFRVGDYTFAVEEFAAPVANAKPDSNDPLDIDPLDDPLGDPLGRPADPAFPHVIPYTPNPPRHKDPFDKLDEARNQPSGSRDLFRGAEPANKWVGPSQPNHADAPRHAVPPGGPPRPPPVDFDVLDALLGDLSSFDPTPPPDPPQEPRAASPLDEFDDLLPAGRPASPSQQAASLRPGPSPQPSRETTPREPVAQDTPGTRAGLRAFLEGAGIPGAAVGDDPEAELRHLGQVFRALTGGLREVLNSRAAVKIELRIEQTMLRPANNNALKFSLDTGDAVAALLSAGRSGYMPPLAATREAFGDIKSHELAVMAGVRNALMALLHRFDPDTIEARISQSRVSSFLPAARKAELWDNFRNLYRIIVSEAEDDFQAIFGRGFATAYKAHTQKD
jgi:type VI secretion system FHA domain protein